LREIGAEGQKLNSPKLLLAGWGCRQRFLSDGRRQIFDFILPGDVFGLCYRPEAVALCNAVTLTRAVVSNAAGLGDAVMNHGEAVPGPGTLPFHPVPKWRWLFLRWGAMFGR